MRKLISGLLVTAALAFSVTAALGQNEPTPTTKTTTTTVKNPDGTTQVTKTTQNSDGTYTIIEYPVGRPVAVSLSPVSLTGANGTATILRDPSGTTIKLNLTGLPADLTSLNVYAVDPMGMTTLLGPVTVTDGIGEFTTTTPMDKFMLIASPEASLTTYGPDTKIYFRSTVPEGFAVVPFTRHPVGEKVSAVSTSGETSASGYSVPMLNIPAYKKGDDTKLKVNFSGAMEGARANIFITPRKGGTTEIRFRFHELKEAPKGKVFIVWAVSADNQFSRLGQIVNTRGRNEGEIHSETTLRDFGLLVTLEDKADVSMPAGDRVGTVEIIRTN